MTYGKSPRNPVVGPGRKVVDLSLAKSFRVPNGQRIQFRVEAFNAFNWVNWGNPNGTLGNSNFGIISSARRRAEMQLSLKYVFRSSYRLPSFQRSASAISCSWQSARLAGTDAARSRKLSS